MSRTSTFHFYNLLFSMDSEIDDVVRNGLLYLFKTLTFKVLVPFLYFYNHWFSSQPCSTFYYRYSTLHILYNAIDYLFFKQSCWLPYSFSATQVLVPDYSILSFFFLFFGWFFLQHLFTGTAVTGHFFVQLQSVWMIICCGLYFYFCSHTGSSPCSLAIFFCFNQNLRLSYSYA